MVCCLLDENIYRTLAFHLRDICEVCLVYSDATFHNKLNLDLPQNIITSSLGQVLPTSK